MEEAKEPVKPWERPWTTEEMRQHSANWNLAGDAGLLKHLQEFSQNLLARTHSTEVALDSLVEELKATSTDVNNVTNQFLCLANTQFVENRVYDDDEKETPPEEKKEEEKPKSKEEQEAEVVTRVREALALGISVLDTMFDAVEVPASDSEDEESGGRVVLEPHNPYLSRPLPYLIGSRQFMEDDNVGLGSQSDSEETGADRNLIQSSESESEMEVEQKEVPKKRTRLSSTSASENSDFGASDNSNIGPGPGKQKKLDSSGLFGNVAPANTGNMFGGDSPTDEVSVDDGAVKRNTFAAELAAKLGGVAADASLADQTAPKLKSSASKPSMVWEDEDDDDGLFGRRDGKYSGGRGLFDDLEDSPGSLWNTKEKPSDKGATIKQPSLFGHDTENEDDIFSAGASVENKETKKSLLRVAGSGIKTSTPITDSGFLESEKSSDAFNAPKKSSLFDGADIDDNLFDAPKTTSRDSEEVTDEPKQSENKKKKKPVGGVSMFGSVDLFKAGIRRPPSSLSCSSDESEQPQSKDFLFNTTQSISSIPKISGEQEDSAESKVTPAAGANKKVSLFDGDDDSLFAPVVSTSQNSQTRATTAEPRNSEPQASSGLFQDDVASDSLFAKPQKILSHGPAKPAAGVSSTAKLSTASRKPTSLFNDSDSGDDELLFSSTSSTSSRSRRSQGSGDLLASSADKVKPSAVQKKGLFDNEDALFGGLKDDPSFDIFSTGTSATKSNARNLGNGNLFGDTEDNIFKSSTSTSASKDNVKNGSKDILFGDDDSFDIFGNSNSAKPQKSVDQVDSNKNISVKSSEYVKSTSRGLFSDDPLDDIFNIPINAQKQEIPSKVTLTDSLFSGNSALASGVDDLFSEPVKHKQDDKELSKTNEHIDQTDDIFSIPKSNSIKIAAINETISKDNVVTDSNILSSNEYTTNSVVAEVSTEQNDVKPSGVFSALGNESNNDLFGKSDDPSISEKPVIPNKPVIKQKPKIPPASKPSQLKNSSEEASVERSTTQDSNSVNSKESITEEKVLINSSLTSKNEKAASLPEQITVVSTLVSETVDKTEKVTAKKPSPQPTKPEPPKTLNIRKTTGLLFSSSSNEDEDLFGLGFPSKGLAKVYTTEVIEEKIKNKSSPSPQDDKPKLFSTDKRSKSEKEISSKLGFSQENIASSTVKARSVGASPRHLNIDPSALLPGAKPPPRGQHNAEAAVSFDRPAQLNTTLHSAGKERARIQAKRRPPSRKARQEAVRNSGLDFEGFEAAAGMDEHSVTSSSLPKATGSLVEPNTQISSANDRTPDVPPTKENILSFLNGSSNNLLSPSTDEEDLFGVPQDLPPEYESTKDDGQSLFTSAPVLSPLEFKSDSLPIFPEETISTETSANNLKEALDSNGGEHIDKIPKDSLDKIPLQADDILPSENIPDDKNDVYDTFRNEPPVDDFDEEDDDDCSDLFSVSKKKVAPLQKEDNLFESVKDSSNIFLNVKSLPEDDILDHIGDVENSQKESKVPPQNEPLLFGNKNKPVFQNIPKSESSDELFSSGSMKPADDLFSSKKTSNEKVHDDLFLPSKSEKNNSNSYVVQEDDLFSTSTKTSANKDNKSKVSMEKSNIFVSKRDDSVDDDSLFSSGKQNQFLSPENDLFSSTVKDANPSKTATPEKKINSDLFGGVSPEGDDLFFSTSKKKVGSSVTKEKSSIVSGNSVKGSLFDEDEDDDIFGGRVKSHASKKPANVPIANEDSLFGSSSTKKKPQMKVSNATSSSSNLQAAKEDDLFEDPLMVITKK